MGFRRRINANLQSQNHVHTPASASVYTCYVLRGGPAIVSVMIAKNGEGMLAAAGVLLKGDRKAFLTLDPAVSVVMAPPTPALMRVAGYPFPTIRSGSSGTGPGYAGRVPLPMTTLGRCLMKSAPDFFSRSGTGGRLLVCSDLRPGRLSRRLCRPGLSRLSPLYPAACLPQPSE